MIDVSIIVPVYNAQMHLKKCIESLLSQTLLSCEFIFINDGSSDESQTIIEDFQKTDHRIILLNQENQGVSAARNLGLKMAKGEYIGFVDADDTVNDSMFQTLLELAHSTKADIIVSKFMIHQNGNEYLSSSYFLENTILNAEYIKNKIIPHLIKFENLNAIWNKLFKKELIENGNITFPIGVALGEDGLFNMQAFYNAKSAYFTDYTGYHYLDIEGSATRDFIFKNYFDKILEEYNYDYTAFSTVNLDAETITKLKAEKCINKSISLLHEYANPKNKLGFKMAYKNISKMLTNPVFKQVVLSNYQEIKASKGVYERFILFAIKNKLIYLLFIALAYSRFRNKK